MDIAGFARILVATMIGLAWTSASRAEDPPAAEIEKMREALAKYKDPYVAVRDLYLSTVGCVHSSGEIDSSSSTSRASSSSKR